MRYLTSKRVSRGGVPKMPLVALLCALLLLAAASSGAAAVSRGEMVLANVTRFAKGDVFSLVGSDCGPTRCMEISQGTALAALGSGDACVCQCRRENPTYREDQRICVDHIEECPMATFGREAKKPQIPFVFLPMKGQIIYPSKEIVFTDVEDAICAVTSAQYLSPSGWVTLRDLLDNDVPFGLYRDEGSTFLQWRGSPALHARLEGRLVAAHVLCSAPAPTRLAASCAAFRVSGVSHSSMLDVHSISFNAGEVVTSEPSTQNQGLSVLESLAIGICVLLLIFVYAAGIIFYIHYKQRQKRKQKDPENNTMSTDGSLSNLGSRIDLDNVMLKTNPLLKMEGLGGLGADFLHDAGLSDVSERTEDTLESAASTISAQKFQKLNSNVISAMVHTRRKKPLRPSLRSVSSPDRVAERMQRRSASPEIEKAPLSDLAIVDCSSEKDMERQSSPSFIGEPVIRRKLYFNPVFFETDHLKNPPPAAVEFLEKIREVMSIAKDKMTTKRFIPSLSDIPEEESYHSFDLGWDIPCARRGRRFSVISLKHENSRRSVQCSGCPGCGNKKPLPKPALTRSNSCKSCVKNDYKQSIVRKWLDEVPSPAPRTTVMEPSNPPRAAEPHKDLFDSSPDLPRARTPDLLRDSSDCDSSKRVKSPEPKRTIRSPVPDRISSPEPRVYSPEPNRIAPSKPIRAISPRPRRVKSPEPLRISSPELSPKLRRMKSLEPLHNISSPEITPKGKRMKSPEPLPISSPELTPKVTRMKSPERLRISPAMLIPEIRRMKSPEPLRTSSPEYTPKVRRMRSSESLRPSSPETTYESSPNLSRAISPGPARVKSPTKSKNEEESKQRTPLKLIESALKDAMRVKEITIKKDKDKSKIVQDKPKFAFGSEKPKIIHNVPLDKENNMMESPSTPEKLADAEENNKVPPKSQPITSLANEKKSPAQEKVSPSSHVSRRIRKKLPPPPPPPVVPPKPLSTKPLPNPSSIKPPLQLSEIVKEPVLDQVTKTEPESSTEDGPPIPPEIKVKMEAVIKELSKCKLVEPSEVKTEEVKTETIEPIPPKIVIPVVAADSHYYSDDNMLTNRRKKIFVQREPFVDMDSLERNMRKRRRFSLACGQEMGYRSDQGNKQDLQSLRDTLTRSWRDVRKADSYDIAPPIMEPVPKRRSFPVSEVFIDNSEHLYDNIAKPGPLTIQVRGSPMEIRKKPDVFDPDTLDRKPKIQAKKRVEKILLKSGGSFKHKAISHECMKQVTKSSPVFTRKIGSLRQIYEAKTKSQDEEVKKPYYERRGSLPYVGDELASLVKTVKTSELIRRLESQKDHIKPPLAPKQKRGSDWSPKFLRDSPPEERRRSPEERERYQQYLRGENLKRSGRRSNRTRSRRTDIRKFYRTEDSGYLSTDSNESKRRANYLMQLRPKMFPEQTSVPAKPTIVRTPILQHIESDTDDMESICDGRSESGGESIETDSVFFGNYDDSKQMLAELGMTSYEINRKLRHHHHDQIDSGFMGETNIILSGDSDSEHRSVISIVTGRNGRASAASITHLSDDPYTRSMEC